MDGAQNREVLVKKASTLVVVVSSFVASRIRTPIPEPDLLLYSLRCEAKQHRQRTLQRIYRSTDIECVSMIRMSRTPFFALCDLFRQRGLVPESAGCSVEEQVAMFLHIVGHNPRFRVVHQSFARSIDTIHRNFHQVLYAIGEIRNEVIKPPSSTTRPNILGSPRWNHWFKVSVICTISVHMSRMSNGLSQFHILYRISLVSLMAHMSWLEFLGGCSKLSGVGKSTPHRM
jgi:hypothetical protein